jgi:hypothetical protein
MTSIRQLGECHERHEQAHKGCRLHIFVVFGVACLKSETRDYFDSYWPFWEMNGHSEFPDSPNYFIVYVLYIDIRHYRNPAGN